MDGKPTVAEGGPPETNSTDEIEITPAMIRAGIEAFVEHDPRFVFQQMDRARRRLKGVKRVALVDDLRRIQDDFRRRGSLIDAISRAGSVEAAEALKFAARNTEGIKGVDWRVQAIELAIKLAEDHADIVE